MFYDFVRPVLFRLDPERAHRVAFLALQAAHRLGLSALLSGAVPHSPRRVMGLEFPNPVGLAAGLDKNGEYIDALAALGFGFIEVGTVTPRPQPGNPAPRLFRLPAARALINRMGFNNKGIDYLLERVRQAKFRGVLGINIGKNFDTPVERAVDDYLIGLRKAYPHAGYIAVNISSPNTPGLRTLQYGETLEQLLGALREEQLRLAREHGRQVPVTVKIAPDLDAEEVRTIAQVVRKCAMDAVIATNTTLSREGVEGLPHAQEAGGLSGAPVFARSTEVLRQLRQQLGADVPIIAAGGIMSGADAKAKIAAGADLVQIYTGFIYRGPALIREIAAALQ
ncbi:MAG: quinone-dependent dihydroorotate dehydrogenase [Gammaproteobacteria bacterium]